MSKILNLDDMLSVLIEIGHPNAEHYKTTMESTGYLMSAAIAQHFGIATHGSVEFEDGFGGTCASFKQKHDGQECPDEIHDRDVSGDFNF